MSEDRTEAWVYIGETLLTNGKLCNTWITPDGEEHMVNFNEKTAIGNIYTVNLIAKESGGVSYRLGTYVKRTSVIEPDWLFKHEQAVAAHARRALEKRLTKERSSKNADALDALTIGQVAERIARTISRADKRALIAAVLERLGA